MDSESFSVDVRCLAKIETSNYTYSLLLLLLFDIRNVYVFVSTPYFVIEFVNSVLMWCCVIWPNDDNERANMHLWNVVQMRNFLCPRIMFVQRVQNKQKTFGWFEAKWELKKKKNNCSLMETVIKLEICQTSFSIWTLNTISRMDMYGAWCMVYGTYWAYAHRISFMRLQFWLHDIFVWLAAIKEKERKIKNMYKKGKVT